MTSKRPFRRTVFCFLLVAGAGLALTALAAVVETDRQAAQPSKSQVVRQDETKVTRGEWGHMLHYFAGESQGTRDVLVAVATVEPGKAVHRAHRHSMEEYLMLLEGAGVWSLDGKEIPAKAGDVLYVEPWIYHGLTNTGDKALRFAVVRYTSKGVAPPSRPDERPDEL